MPIITCASWPAAAERSPPHDRGRALPPDLAGLATVCPMTLTCPLCGTRYRVDERDLAGPSGRTVRCANCGHAWHEAAAGGRRADGPATHREAAREAPASKSTTRAAPKLEISPRPLPGPPAQTSRRRSAAAAWTMLIALLMLVAIAVLAAVAWRRQLAGLWPPAARLYAAVGMPVEARGAGLVIGKIAPSRISDGLMIDGEIANLGGAPQDVPRLRVALQDAADKEVQFEIVEPPKPRLQPGEVAHFATPFKHPDDAATGVVVTFAPR